MALATAGKLMGKRSRLIVLAARYVMQVDRTTSWKVRAGTARERLKQLGRLVSAYAHGKYNRIPVKALLTIAAAMLYFLNPFDLIPDAIPGLGLSDDLAILTWVYQSLSAEMTAFLEWEKKLST